MSEKRVTSARLEPLAAAPGCRTTNRPEGSAIVRVREDADVSDASATWPAVLAR